MTPVWDEEFDVVVVGTGAGALAGALAAATRGARTVVVEKTDLVGGTTAYSGGGIWIPGNHVILRHGIADSIELGRTYLRSTVGDRTPAALQDAFLEHGPVLVEELDRNPRFEFEWRPFPDYFENLAGAFEVGRSIYALPLTIDELDGRAEELRPPLLPDRGGSPQPPGMIIGGRALLARFLLALADAGVEVRRGWGLTRLITDAECSVVGVELSHADGAANLRASRGVLLAAGGFERNEEMRRRYQRVGAAWTMGSPGGTGDAIRCGIDIGADTDLLDQAWWSPGFLMPDGTAGFRLYERGRPGALVVNQAGERYADETLPYDQFGQAMRVGDTTGVGHIPSWWVCDRRFLERYVFCGIEPGAPIPHEWFESGALIEAGSLAELGERLGTPAGVLEATVTRFNGFAASGVDEDFHRGATAYDRFFGDPAHGPNPCLGALSEPPFFAATMVLSDLGTKGGLRCDEHARVLRPDGSAIAGLYAAGNTMASVMGTVYPGPGCPIGSSMAFASLAARDMMRG